MTRISSEQEVQLALLARARAEEAQSIAELRARLEAQIAGSVAVSHAAIVKMVYDLHASGVPLRRIGQAYGTKDHRTIQGLVAEGEAQYAGRPAQETWKVENQHVSDSGERFWYLHHQGTGAGLWIQKTGDVFQPAVRMEGIDLAQDDPAGEVRRALRTPEVQEWLRGQVEQ